LSQGVKLSLYVGEYSGKLLGVHKGIGVGLLVSPSKYVLPLRVDMHNEILTKNGHMQF